MLHAICTLYLYNECFYEILIVDFSQSRDRQLINNILKFLSAMSSVNVYELIASRLSRIYGLIASTADRNEAVLRNLLSSRARENPLKEVTPSFRSYLRGMRQYSA